MQGLWNWLNANPGVLFLVAFGVVVAANVWGWQLDRRLAQKRRSEKHAAQQLTSTLPVSVLVAAWNEARLLREHIESFLRLSYPDRELVLCAGGTDGTLEIAHECAGRRNAGAPV